MAVASLVLGIISCAIGCFFSAIGYVGTICGIIGIILAAVALKRGQNKKMSTAGLVLSIIGAALGIILFLACAACIGVAAVSGM